MKDKKKMRKEKTKKEVGVLEEGRRVSKKKWREGRKGRKKRKDKRKGVF